MPFDNTQAFAEGWALFNDGELQRLDEAEVFANDAAAIAYVSGRAIEGSAYHRKAIRLTKWSWLQRQAGRKFTLMVSKKLK